MSFQQAMTCIEESCQRKGIKIYSNLKMCPIQSGGCGGELFPVDDSSVTNMLDDDDFAENYMQRAWSREHHGNVTVITPKPENDVFRCSPDLKGCPIAPTATVQIPLAMFNKWVFLAEQTDTEWIAYLKGYAEQDEPNTYVITDMYFPKQMVTPVHIDVEDGEIQDGTIAAVHSHVRMNAFFSGEDEAHFNHTVEMVVNAKGEIKAMARVQLKCGSYQRGEAKIEFLDCAEELALQEQLKAVLSHGTQTFSVKKDSPKNSNNSSQMTMPIA